MGRDKLLYLGVYFAYSTLDMSFKQPAPVVVLNATDLA